MVTRIETSFLLSAGVKGTDQVKNLSRTMSDIGKSAKESARGVDNLEKSFNRLQSAAIGFLSFDAIKNIGVAIGKTGLEFERLQRILSESVGDANAAPAFEFLKQTADQYGQELLTLSKNYAQLAASTRDTGLASSDLNELFLGLTKASASFGLSADGVNKVFLAITQIASKGKVTAEELRGQLGEKLFGAFNLAAKSIGITTGELDKFLQEGRVNGIPFLREFSKLLNEQFAGGAEKASTSAQAAFSRLQTSIELLKKEAADNGVLQAFADVATDLTSVFRSPEVLAGIRGFAQGVSSLIGVIRENGAVIAQFLQFAVAIKAVASGAGAGARLGAILGPKGALAGGVIGGLGAAFATDQAFDAIAGGGGASGPTAFENQLQAAASSFGKTKDQIQSNIDQSLATVKNLGVAYAQALQKGDAAAAEIAKNNLAQATQLLGAYKSALSSVENAGAALDPVIRPKEPPKNNPVATFLGNLEVRAVAARLELERLKSSAGADVFGRNRGAVEGEISSGSLASAGGDAQARARRLADELDDAEKRTSALRAFNNLVVETKAQIDNLKFENNAFDTLGVSIDGGTAALERFRIKTAAFDLGVDQNILADLEKQLEVERQRKKVIEERSGSERFKLDLQERNDSIRSEIKGLQLTTVEREVLNEKLELTNKLAEINVGKTDETRKANTEYYVQAIAQSEQLIRSRFEEARSVEVGLKGALQSYVEAAEDAASQIKNLGGTIFSGLEDALVEFVKTQKLSFQSLGETIINELTRIAIRAQVITPILRGIQGLGGGGGIIGSIVGSIFGGAGGGGGNVAQGIRVTPSANGNIMTDSGPLPLRKYANGGIARSPQLALFGEGRMPEAYVPLPDGRRIPVAMEGSGGGSVSVNVYNNAANSNAQVQERTDSSGVRQIDVIIDQVESGMARKIAKGGGLAPVLERQYGLNRAAGALR